MVAFGFRVGGARFSGSLGAEVRGWKGALLLTEAAGVIVPARSGNSGIRMPNKTLLYKNLQMQNIE